jgi:hypothetical protein
MRWTGQIFWLLAFEEVDSLSLTVDSDKAERLWLPTLNHQLLTSFTFFPPSPLRRGIGILPMKNMGWKPKPLNSTIGPMGSRIQLQQRNCSRFSRDFLRRSTFPSSQRTGTRSSGLRFPRQDY